MEREGRDATRTPAEPRERPDRDETGERADAAGPRPIEGRSPRPIEAEDDVPPLLSASDLDRYLLRWEEIQAGFVDEPRGSVERADALVAEVMQNLTDTFAAERAGLEEQWARGEDASTEDLRVALTRYRVFFERLLAA